MTKIDKYVQIAANEAQNSKQTFGAVIFGRGVKLFVQDIIKVIEQKSWIRFLHARTPKWMY